MAFHKLVLGRSLHKAISPAFRGTHDLATAVPWLLQKRILGRKKSTELPAVLKNTTIGAREMAQQLRRLPTICGFEFQGI